MSDPEVTEPESIPPVTGGTKVELSIIQLLAVIGAFATGAGSIGFVYGSLLPRFHDVERSVQEIQKTQQMQAVTLARVTTLLEQREK